VGLKIWFVTFSSLRKCTIISSSIQADSKRSSY